MRFTLILVIAAAALATVQASSLPSPAHSGNQLEKRFRAGMFRFPKTTTSSGVSGKLRNAFGRNRGNKNKGGDAAQPNNGAATGGANTGNPAAPNVNAPAPKDNAVAPPKDNTPAPPTGNTPAPPKDNTPAPPTGNTPAPPKDNTPAPAGDNLVAPGAAPADAAAPSARSQKAKSLAGNAALGVGIGIVGTGIGNAMMPANGGAAPAPEIEQAAAVPAAVPAAPASPENSAANNATQPNAYAAPAAPASAANNAVAGAQIVSPQGASV